MKHLIIGIMLLSVIGCATTKYVIVDPFDYVSAQSIFKTGDNTIKGCALIRQRGGGIVTCAGCEVLLVPATNYAVRRMLIIYDSEEKGYKSLSGFTMPMSFEPDPPEYYECRLKTIGDTNGMFEFNNVADGDYFVVTSIIWNVKGATQGGNIMQRVKVANGETIRLVLTT